MTNEKWWQPSLKIGSTVRIINNDNLNTSRYREFFPIGSTGIVTEISGSHIGHRFIIVNVNDHHTTFMEHRLQPLD